MKSPIYLGFLMGISSISDIYTHSKYPDMTHKPPSSDIQAMRGDWVSIGHGFKKAIDKEHGNRKASKA